MAKSDNDEFEFQILQPTLDALLGDDIEHQTLSPLSCLKELGSKWILEIDLPLVDKKNISVALDSDNTLTIEAKLKESFYDEKLGKTNEFKFFKKSITLPGKINEKEITAKFENGRLSVIIPKLFSGKKIKIT